VKKSIRDFKPPQEILNSAKEKAEKICESGDDALRSVITGLDEELKEKMKKFELTLDKIKSFNQEIDVKLNNIKSDIEKKPNTNDILVQIADRYKTPQDLSEIILQKVSLAFVCLQNLSSEERQEIMKVLTIDSSIKK
jgi:ribosome recycling factor